MPTQHKIDQVADIKDRIERSTIVIGARYRGLTVQEMQVLRRKLREGGLEFRVIKNSLLKLAAEVRQQLGLQLTITRTLVDLKVVREFQRSVTETIAEVDPSVAREIVAKLKERRALRASGSLPALDGQGGFDVA